MLKQKPIDIRKYYIDIILCRYNMDIHNGSSLSCEYDRDLKNEMGRVTLYTTVAIMDGDQT